MDDVFTRSALELAADIREGARTSRDVVDAHISQIEKVNPTINAVVRERFDEARAEAEGADRLQASGAELPLLHGVPCTIKESFALVGMPNSSGLVARKDVIADTDATTVSRLRRSGAIPIGVTNISELCMWMESNNQVYGRSNNPYAPSRIVGGSSGGEGALVGAPARRELDVGQLQVVELRHDVAVRLGDEAQLASVVTGQASSQHRWLDL